MKLQEIEEMWEKDSVINRLNLFEESLNIPYLHGRYHRIYNREKMVLFAMASDLKQLKLDKFEFYTQGPTRETPEHWQLPDSGRVLKTDAARYMDADKDIRDAEFKIAQQTTKVNFIESIIDSFKNRGFAIKNALDVRKFEAGA